MDGERLAVRIGYVDGAVRTGPPSSWGNLPGEGVDWFEVLDDSGAVRFHAASLYWLYPEGESWVAGCASVHYDPNPINEIVFAPLDEGPHQYERQRPYLPDLRLAQVKLGWWWPGKEQPTHG